MALKAVLFDMDGVIVNTEPLHRKAYFEMFAHFNIDVSEELYNSFTGKATLGICQELVQRFALSAAPEELIAKKRERFKVLFDNDPEFDLIPGVRELIENYHQNDIKMVLASSASMTTINWVFERFGLEEYFIDKISGADLKASKPHPEIFELAAKKAGEDRKDCMVIEDSTNGIKAAHAAGIYCIAYNSEHSKDQDYSLAQQVISDYKTIHVENLNQPV
ncbi:MAG TPA: HAD family phosphatase [Balneolaceae bacterium]|nr:HAD family phosphatase [Balneolaceae bacterium]